MKIVLVDKNNKKIGVEEKIKVHREGKLHRAFSIFIFNSKKELLIQQRTKTKYHSGGLWSNTCCSHPRPNETYQRAISRRLKEEMGFDCKLKKLFCLRYNLILKEGLIENEYNCVFVGKFSGKPKPNSKEVMNYKWVSIKELKSDIIKNPDKYTAWLKKILKKIRNFQISEAIK